MLLQALLWPETSRRGVHLLGKVADALRREGQRLKKLFPTRRAWIIDPVLGSGSPALLLYLHAVMDVVDHREALSVLQALPVLRGALPRAKHPVLALGGRYGEVLPGVGLGGDGVSLWAWRRGLILMEKSTDYKK